MSYDLAVWFPNQMLSDEEALQQYYELFDENIGSLIAHPAIGAFYVELCKLHPQIDDVPEERVGDFDFSPWSIAHGLAECHVMISCVWSHGNYVHDLVLRLARKHGLAMFDPQQTKIHYPTNGDT